MDNQRTYFDVATHRYPTGDAVNPPVRQQQELAHLQSCLGKLSGKHIIDFGAGSGRVTFWFLKRGYDVTAVDISPKSLEDLARIYKRIRTPSWGTLSTTTHFPTSALADAVVGADILHHVDIPAYLPQFVRALKPGGRLAFSEPNGRMPLWYIFLLLNRLPWSIERGIVNTTSGNLRATWRNAGLRNIAICGHGLFAYRLIITAQV